MQTLVIVDYGSGNLRSAAKAAERAAREGGIAAQVLVTDAADKVAAADRLLLPGVGAFRDCALGLAARGGLRDAIAEAVEHRAVPFLGICVGAQLMAREGLEHGRTPGFGWIDGTVAPITPADRALKIPHMGWNSLAFDAGAATHPVLAGLVADDHAYFVHSYHIQLDDPAMRLASVGYGGDITAIVGRDNMIGTQFHPEKSQQLGLRLLSNFWQWRP